MLRQIAKLIRLQELDNQLRDLEKQLAAGPRKIQQLQAGLQSLEEELKGELGQIEARRKERRSLEQEIDVLEGRITKSNAKLGSIKSNKEYQAALKEIDDLKAQKERLEDRVLEMMEEAEAWAEQSKKANRQLEEARGEVAARCAEVEKNIKALKGALQDCRELRTELCGELDPALLKRYTFIAQHKGGIAIGPVLNGTCQVCHLGIPPQQFRELLRGDQLMDCPNCKRMIYWGEDKRLQGEADPDIETHPDNDAAL